MDGSLMGGGDFGEMGEGFVAFIGGALVVALIVTIPLAIYGGYKLLGG